LGRLQATHWLWRNVPQVLPPNLGVTGEHGKLFARWGIGQSLLMLPADLLSWPIVEHLHPGRLRDAVQVGLVSYLTFPLLNACTVVLAYRLLMELGFSATESELGAIGLLFGTSFLPYAQIQQENSLMFFSLIGGLLGNIRWLRTHDWRHLCLGAGCLGWGLLVRLPCIFDAFAVALFMLFSIMGRKQGRKEKLAESARFILQFGSFYLPFILADRFYQWVRFGSITSNYETILAAQQRAADPLLPPSFPFSTPFLDGFTGFLLSPAKSIFLFNPLLILSSVLVLRYRNALRQNVKLFFGIGWLALFMQICFYARLAFWGGDAAWGPRYVMSESQLVALIAIPALVRISRLIKSRFETLCYTILIALACVIQFAGCLYDYNLELAQEAAFHVKYIIIWQRFINTVALASGTFQSRGLDPGLAQSGSSKFAVLAFMPWRTEGQLPQRITHVLQAGWVAGCLLLLAILANYLLRIRREAATHRHVGQIISPAGRQPHLPPESL
jgi:hypothetical protein